MFTGYSDKTVDFFWQIRFNNSREWFHPRKDEFNAVIMNPTRELANELYDWFQEKYPKLNLNLHISRIYRDARRLFGRGPLKDHIWFSFQNEIGPRELSPCFWFEVNCDGYSYGMGNWATPDVAARYRRLIDLAPEKFDALARRFEQQEIFALAGESYARPKGHAGERIGAWYNKKYISLSCDRKYDALCYSHDLVGVIEDGYTFLMPYYEFFDKAYRMAD